MKNVFPLDSGEHLQEALIRRPRRNRRTASIREMTQETHLRPSQLAAPLFIVEGTEQIQPIPSMPDVFRYSIDEAISETAQLYEAGIRAIDLFTVVPAERKDRCGTEAVREGNLLQRSIRKIKAEIPEMCVMVDIALDPFTDHGHDGVLNESGEIVNDETLNILSEMSVLAAEAGADMIAPSDMMDGRVAFIRHALDDAGHSGVGIMSYTAKYASSFYGPFRDALESAPKFGDKKTYQMNPANIREALVECALDETEGADIILIKPAGPYLDVIAAVRKKTSLPIAAYHVSGEYSMVMAAAERGWINPDTAFLEILLGIKRAGADLILTYAAKRIAKKLSF